MVTVTTSSKKNTSNQFMTPLPEADRIKEEDEFMTPIPEADIVRSSGGGGSSPAPTKTEEQLQQSLPAGVRDQSVEEVQARQSIPKQEEEPIEQKRTLGQKVESGVRRFARETAPDAPIRALEERKLQTLAIFNNPVLGRARRTTEATSQFREEALVSFVPTTKEEVVFTGVTLGAGAGVGAGLKLGGAGLSRLGPKALSIGRKTGVVTGIGLAEVFALEKIEEFDTAEGAGAKGSVVGTTGREVLTFGAGVKVGSKGSTELIGRLRTKGRKEIPAEEIVAPEVAQGQTFPLIKKGQTAGELKKEFSPQLPGETKPALFTAAPEPVSELTVRRGSSEVPGLFGAPKVSTHFLRLTKSEKLTPPLQTSGLGGRPTIFRTTPESVELSPLVKPGQRTFASKEASREFIETAPKGKAFVTFIKPEKEAVIPFQTKLEPTGKRFFTKVSGERVPIDEFRTVGKGKPSKTSKPFKEIVSSSSGRPGSSSVVSPESVGFFSLVSSSKSKPSSKVTPSSAPLPSSAPRPSSPSTSDFVGRPEPPSKRKTPSSNIISSPKKTSSPVSSIVSSPKQQFTSKTPPIPLAFGLALDTKPAKRVKPTRSFKRRPSFVAVELGITSPSPLKSEFTGLGLRPVISKRKKRR